MNSKFGSLSRRVVGTVLVFAGVTVLANCSAADTANESSDQAAAVAPVSGQELSLAGRPSKGSTLTLNGKLSNTSPDAITIVGGSAYFATQFQVVKNPAKNSGDKTQQVGVPIEVAGNASIDLGPDGYQIAVRELTQKLEPGATVPVNITLANGKSVRLLAKVS